MAEQLGDLTRTHTCGALRPSDVGANVVLLGWVHRVRDLGGLGAQVRQPADSAGRRSGTQAHSCEPRAKNGPALVGYGTVQDP